MMMMIMEVSVREEGRQDEDGRGTAKGKRTLEHGHILERVIPRELWLPFLQDLQDVGLP